MPNTLLFFVSCNTYTVATSQNAEGDVLRLALGSFLGRWRRHTPFLSDALDPIFQASQSYPEGREEIALREQTRHRRPEHAVGEAA